VDLLEFSRDHAAEIEVLADRRALFLLTFIGEVRNTTREELSAHLGWGDDVIDPLWQKLNKAGLVRDETAFGRKNPIRLSTLGATMVAALGFPGPKSLFDRLLQASPQQLIAVIGEVGLGKRPPEFDAGKEREITNLLMRARAGDLEAFESVFRTIGPRLYRTSRSILHNPADAEDALQQTFMSLVTGNFDLEHRPIEPLLFRMIKNKSIDILRKRYRRHETSLEEATEEAGAEEGRGVPDWLEESWAELQESRVKQFPQSPPTQEEAAIFAEELGAAVATLSPREVRVLTLWMEGMNLLESAELLRMSPGHVAHVRMRVKARLAEVLGRRLGKREPRS
jgi:RNA polymerase sigma-70 factor (ECF subfamily)